MKVLGTIEGDKETGKKRLEELDQGTGTEEVVGEMYVVHTMYSTWFSFAKTLIQSSVFLNSVKEIAINKAHLSPAAKDALNMVGGEKNVKDLTKV